LIDIDRSQQAEDATRRRYSARDTAYELVRSNIELLKPYKAKYNDQALRVRDTVLLPTKRRRIAETFSTRKATIARCN